MDPANRNRWRSRLLTLSTWPRGRPLAGISASLIGLLVAITIAGVVALAINRNVHEITESALERDVELEDLTDDLRVAVLDVRHYHLDMIFYGPSAAGLQSFEDAYRQLIREIDNLAEHGIGELDAAQPSELRTMAERYHAIFRPALSAADPERGVDADASDEALKILADLGSASARLDRLGEERAEVALASIDQANNDARLVLFGVLTGLVLVGLGLAYAAVRLAREMRRLYEAQETAAGLLTDALQAKSNFIADASHELRTPLTVLRGNAEAGLAMDRTCVHREILEEIVAESARMTRLVEDLLLLARSDAASVPLDAEPVSVEPLLTELAERAAVLAQDRGASLTTALAARGTITVDVTRIEQAVLILIDNAAKYSPPGGQIWLASSTWQNELIIEVIDQGSGVPESVLPMIFERFYRVDKARSRKLGGAGLGLSIAKTIVDAHSGRIDAESRPGEGTKMRIHLPLTPAPPTARSGLQRVA